MREQLARPAAAPAPRAAPRSAARVPARRVAARPATPPAMRALERTETAVAEAEGARGAALRERRGPPDAAAPDAAPASPADPTLLPPLAVAPAEEAATDEPGEPADLDALLGAIAEAGQAGRDRAAAQALSGRADVARRGGRAEGGLRAGLTRALTTIRTGHATERRRVEAMIAAAHNQIDAAHHARADELGVKGRDGITALRGVFTAHRDTLVGILAAAATRAQRIRTQGATRLDTRARAQETEAYAAGRDAWHHYGSGERGLRMADAASGVAIAVGEEIRAKRTEALAELEAGCVGLVDGVDQARRDSLTGLMDGLPGLEAQVRSGFADARTELQTQRDAAHGALAEAAAGLLAELDAAERAAVARAEAALPPQIRQLHAAIHAARQGLAGAEEAARRGLTQREGEAEAILSEAEEPEADSAAAFTTEAVAMLAGMAEDAATEIAALPEAAGGAMDGLRRSGAAGLDQMARAAVAQAGARAAGIATQLDVFVARVDGVLAGTPTRLEASLRQGRDDVRDQLRPGATALRTQLNEMLDPAAREVEARVTEALGHNAIALGQMRGRMQQAANDAAWDFDHPYLATARDIGMVIAGVIVGILLVIAVVVAVIVACKAAIFLLVAAGVSAAVAEVIVIVAAIAVAGYFAYQAYAEHRAAGQGGWEAAGNAALDMIGVNQMRAAFAPNLTPFERGLSFGQGAATFVTTFIPFARAARARIPARFAGRVPALRVPRPLRVARVAVARSPVGRPVVRAWNNPARLGEAANAALPAPIRSALGVPARGVNIVGEGAIGAARSAWRSLMPRRPGIEPAAPGTPPPTPEPPAPPPAAPPVAEAPRLPTPEAPRPAAPVAEAPRPAAPRPATPEAPARASPEAPTRATPETPARTPAPTPPRAEAPPRPTEPATPTTPAEAPARAEPAPPELRLVRGGSRGDGRPRGRLGEAGRTPPRPAEPLPTEAAAEAVPELMRLAAGAEGGVVEGGPRPWRPEVIQGGAGRGPVASIEGAGGGGPRPGPAPAPASTTPAPRRTGGRGRGGGRSAPRAADPAAAAPDAAAPTRPAAGRATPTAAEAGATEAGAAEAAVAEAATPPPAPRRGRGGRARPAEPAAPEAPEATTTGPKPGTSPAATSPTGSAATPRRAAGGRGRRTGTSSASGGAATEGGPRPNVDPAAARRVLPYLRAREATLLAEESALRAGGAPARSGPRAGVRARLRTVRRSQREVRADVRSLRDYVTARQTRSAGGAAEPPATGLPEGYRPAPGERAMGREAWHDARRAFHEWRRTLDPDAAVRALPDGPAAGPPPVAETHPFVETARSVVREAMDAMGLGRGNHVHPNAGQSVGNRLDIAIRSMWANRPELSGTPLHANLRVDARLPSGSPLADLTVPQFLRRVGRPELLDSLPGRMRNSTIGDLRLDLLAEMPDGSLLVFDLTGGQRADHVAKTMLYGLIFEGEGRLVRFVEIYWRSL
jgi:hypothetical protein